MRKDSYSFTQNYSINNDNQTSYNKSQKTLNISYNNRSFERNQRKNKGQKEEQLSNAYNNVINVIANLLENIEDEITNGKSNLKYINETNIKQRKQKLINKKPVAKMISYSPQKSKFSLNNNNNKDSTKSFKRKIISLKSLDVKKHPKKKEASLIINKQKKRSVGSNNCNFSIIDELNSSINMDKKKNANYQSKLKFTQKKLNIFFKPKNKLKAQFTSEKNIFPKKKRCSQNSNNSSKEGADDKFISSIVDTKKNAYFKKSSLFFSASTDSKMKSSVIKSSRRSKETDTNNHSSRKLSPFNFLKETIKVDPETIQSKLYEYENNEITHEINQLPLPDNDLLMKKKKLHHIKEFNFESRIKKIIHLKPLRNNFVRNMAQFNKETKYRTLVIKGHVYDSLDDDEETDEEEIDTCYFDPKSRFIYILDSITFVSSLIILLYFPLILASSTQFCYSLRDKNTILFASIDIIYIIDLIINFYRGYYNYNDILIKKIF